MSRADRERALDVLLRVGVVSVLVMAVASAAVVAAVVMLFVELAS
jgi:hypothetical protein